jgi:hypothetical protein
MVCLLIHRQGTRPSPGLSNRIILSESHMARLSPQLHVLLTYQRHDIRKQVKLHGSETCVEEVIDLQARVIIEYLG